MNAAKEGTENKTHTHGRTETYGSYFISGKIIIIFTMTIISVSLLIVILRGFYNVADLYDFIKKITPLMNFMQIRLKF